MDIWLTSAAKSRSPSKIRFMHIFRVSKGINLRVSIGVKLQNTTCLRHGIIYWLWPLPYLMLNTFTHCQYPPAAIGILPIDFLLSVWDRGTRLKKSMCLIIHMIWDAHRYYGNELHQNTKTGQETRKQGKKKAVLPPEKLHLVGYLVHVPYNARKLYRCMYIN